MFHPQWAGPGQCWTEEKIEISFRPPIYVFEEKSVNCTEKHQAVCEEGQMHPLGVETCVHFELAPFQAESFDQAQKYCQSISFPTWPYWTRVGDLPFFRSESELYQFNKQANLTDYREQLLGLFRDPTEESRWEAYYGDMEIEVEVFSWGPGQPNPGVNNTCVMTRNADPYTWNNVPCDFPEGISFSCRIDWEEPAGYGYIPPVLPDPPAA